MDLELLRKLKNWRSAMAREEGVDLFRVLPNKTIEAIAALKPKTKEDIMAIKGIREKKFEKYGASILLLVNENLEGITNQKTEEKNKENKKPYTVSDYLNFLNAKLREDKARVQGEVSSLDIRDNYLFFSLKDMKDESILNCFMWKSNYELCGISLEEGMEIIVDGFSEVYKPSGRINFKTLTIELVGEGALKKAYDELKKKLEKEGLFAIERKRPIPEFPQKIGLVTSETGAVINDFLNNLGKYGYHIKFADSRVEGQVAVRDLLSAVGYFNDKDIDVLAIIRGGGSLESLMAFNNEVLVRKISDFKVPVICGIGHDKDVPLVSLAADKAVSTPTAVAVILNKSWDKALGDITIFEKDIIYGYQRLLEQTRYYFEKLSDRLRRQFGAIFQKFEELKHSLKDALMNIDYAIKDIKKTLAVFLNSLLDNLKRVFKQNNNVLDDIEKRLKIFDPVRQLKLGYSITSVAGRIVKNVRQVSEGNELDIQVSDGKIKSKVKNIIN